MLLELKTVGGLAVATGEHAGPLGVCGAPPGPVDVAVAPAGDGPRSPPPRAARPPPLACPCCPRQCYARIPPRVWRPCEGCVRAVRGLCEGRAMRAVHVSGCGLCCPSTFFCLPCRRSCWPARSGVLHLTLSPALPDPVNRRTSPLPSTPCWYCSIGRATVGTES